MKKYTLSYLLIGLLILTSCSSSTYDDVEEEQDPIPETVTYVDVKPTIDQFCVSCHGNPTENGAPNSLVTYENVLDAVQNRGLLDRISRNEGEDGIMPLGGPRLPQTTIDLFFQWEEDGLLEN